MINFPVIRSVYVSNYGLYRGENDDGQLKREILPGINLIVGVNGIGKTTLLTMLLRALTGLRDIESGGDLGRGARTAGRADKQYFAKRVRDNAANAFVRVEILFGTQTIVVERYLKNLAIKTLKVKDIELRGENAEHFESLYERAIVELSGLPTFYDFLLVLRFVCFFLEDRQPFIWDKNAQYEVLRALFGEKTVDPTAYFTAYNKMTSLDSELRNHRAALSRIQTRLDKATAAKAAEPVLSQQLQELVRLSGELKESLEALEQQGAESRKIAYDARQKLETAKFELGLKRTVLAGVQKAFLVGLFQTAEEDVAHRVLQTLMHGKCTVCGSSEPKAIAALQTNAQKGLCPVCHTPHHLHEHFDDASNASISSDIHDIEQQIGRLTSDIENLEEDSQALTKNFYDLSKKTSDVRLKLHTTNVERTELSRQLGTEKDTPKLDVELVNLRELGEEMAQERKTQELLVKDFLEQVEQQVHSRWQSIADRFETYISGFMAETCTLVYKTDERTLFEGQTDVRVGFPLFSVRLTSGVFESENEAPSRNSITEVSESQKEFIDLAFRMAVIAEAANDTPSMFIVETPEASLDSVFVPRAGAMIRRFLSQEGTSRSLIASVNLNREAMIPALFGVPSEYEVSQFMESKDWPALRSALSQSTPFPDREKHIVNLLAVGIGNAALKKHNQEYQHEYQQALRPSWEDDGLAALARLEQ
jgi:hypothetical protein